MTFHIVPPCKRLSGITLSHANTSLNLVRITHGGHNVVYASPSGCMPTNQMSLTVELPLLEVGRSQGYLESWE